MKTLHIISAEAILEFFSLQMIIETLYSQKTGYLGTFFAFYESKMDILDQKLDPKCDFWANIGQ